jgi:cytochrome c6
MIACCTVAASFLMFAGNAMAGDIAAGSQVFAQNCAACHIGGGNVVNGSKTLKKADLEKYDMYSVDKIATQVTKGKMTMPAFLGRLDETQIANVAAYVYDQADKW